MSNCNSASIWSWLQVKLLLPKKSDPSFTVTYPIPDSPNLIGLDVPACKRLISRTFSPQEVISLIGAIFASKDEFKAVRDLRGDDAQAVIDVIHGVRSELFFSRVHSDYLSSSTPSLPNPHLPPIRP